MAVPRYHWQENRSWMKTKRGKDGLEQLAEGSIINTKEKKTRPGYLVLAGFYYSTREG